MLSDHPVFPILLSTDLDASRAFYRDTLGLEILREDAGDRIVFRCGAGTQLVVTLSTVGTADTQTQMAWRVPDLRAAVDDLRARGVRIEEYAPPTRSPRTGSPTWVIPGPPGSWTRAGTSWRSSSRRAEAAAGAISYQAAFRKPVPGATHRRRARVAAMRKPEQSFHPYGVMQPPERR